MEGRENSPVNTPHTTRDLPIISSLSQNVLISTLKNLNIGNSIDKLNKIGETADIEMHTFRDAIDVNYQRMALTEDELSGVKIIFF